VNETILALIFNWSAVLLPIVPAFLLFKYLPSTGDASGTWQGNSFKFGGAFAGYLVVMVTMFHYRPAEYAHFHTWTVTGALAFQKPASDPEPNINDIYVRVIPPRLSVLNQGMFSWEIPVTEADGRLQFPDLQLDLRDYRGMTVPLGPDRSYGSTPIVAEYDHAARRIIIKQPITMTSLHQGTAYVPTRAEVAVAVPAATAAAPTATAAAGGGS